LGKEKKKIKRNNEGKKKLKEEDPKWKKRKFQKKEK